MITLYKLTDADGYTRRGETGETLWFPGREVLASGKGKLCDHGFVHAYTNPLLAELLNPIHAKINNPRLWEAEGDVAKTNHGLKVGCTRLRTIRRIQTLEIAIEQRVRFGILAALEVCSADAWRKWATRWLSGKDRTSNAAWAAAEAASTRWTAWAAATAAAEADAAWAAWAAVWAAAKARERCQELDLPAIAAQAVATTENE